MPRIGNISADGGVSDRVPSRHALAALYLLLAGLAVIESSDASIVFRIVLQTDTRLPVSLAVLAGAGLVGLLALELSGLLPFQEQFAPISDSEIAAGAQRVHWGVVAAILAALCVLAVHSFGTPIDQTLLDTFHEGEILGAGPLIAHAAEIPILIHGPGRNLLPAALASVFAQPGQEIAFMRFVTEIGAMVTVAMVAMATYSLSLVIVAGRVSPSWRHMIGSLMGLSAAAGAILFANVSNRHALFLAALSLAGWIVAGTDRDRRCRLALSAGLGAICAVAPIYVYSTGLETLAIAAIAAGILVAREGRAGVKSMATALITLASVVALICLLGGGGLYANAVRDIGWWGLEARGIWGHALHAPEAVASTMVTIGTIGLAGYLGWAGLRSGADAGRRNGALYILLAAAVAIATRGMWERSDAAHVGFTLLTVVVVLGVVAALPAAWLAHRRPRLMASCAVASALAVGAAGLLAGDSLSRMVERLNTSDDLILPDDIQAFAGRYEGVMQDADCLLVLTNEGVLNYVLDLPPCGDFFYPVYASIPNGDRALARWLRANPQRLAVIGTEFWSDMIDGRPMSERVPEVWAVIGVTMPFRDQVGGRTVAVGQ